MDWEGIIYGAIAIICCVALWYLIKIMSHVLMFVLVIAFFAAVLYHYSLVPAPIDAYIEDVVAKTVEYVRVWGISSVG